MITTLHLNPLRWENNIVLPKLNDPRWIFGILLLAYFTIGVWYLGFSRSPIQIALLIGFGIAFETLFSGLFKGKLIFPLSAVITCTSLGILLNYSLGNFYVWIPPFIAIGSKYIFTINGDHRFNPSLFAITVCILFFADIINAAPAYQWYGINGASYAIAALIITASLIGYISKINRTPLIVSFWVTHLLSLVLRAYILRHHIPPFTLFVGSITSPSLYLFSMYMLPDPKTSPDSNSLQIITGVSIGLLELFYHTQSSLFTFFFAGFTYASIRFLVGHARNFSNWKMETIRTTVSRILVISLVGVGCASIPFLIRQVNSFNDKTDNETRFERIPESTTSIGYAKSNILNQVDPRLQHISKWLLSVGDAVAIADVDNDGFQDMFLTQPLKSLEWRGKLYINNGDFKFKKQAIPELEKYLDNPRQFGLPSSAIWLDLDNDGDQDLIVGFSFGPSHVFQNNFVQNVKLSFTEVFVPGLSDTNTICLSLNGADLDNNGYVDLIIANVVSPYMTAYSPERVTYNIFNLPKAQYPGDRRMFNVLHNSWQNSTNGGKKSVYVNTNGKLLSEASLNASMPETHWTLSSCIIDFNQDGYSDLYFANDFGPDDLYINLSGKSFKKIVGQFPGEMGRDTYKGMNASAGDVNGDFLEDVYVSNVHHAMQAEGSLLWINSSSARKVNLSEKAQQFGALNPSRFGWGACMADLNLDGYLDIVQANGMVGDDWDKRYEHREDYWYYQEKIARSSPSVFAYADNWADLRGRSIFENEPDRVYVNFSGKRFEDYADQYGVKHRANTRAVASADFDNNGTLDLVFTNQFGAPIIYKNLTSNRNWVGLKLVGKYPLNRDAIGVGVTLSYMVNGKPHSQYRTIKSLNGFSAQSDSRLIFGLGNNKSKVEHVYVTIKWSKNQESNYALKINQYTTLSKE